MKWNKMKRIWFELKHKRYNLAHYKKKENIIGEFYQNSRGTIFCKNDGYYNAIIFKYIYKIAKWSARKSPKTRCGF